MGIFGGKRMSAADVLRELKRGKTVHSPGQPDPELIKHLGRPAAEKIATTGLSAKEAKKLIGKRGGFDHEGTIKSRGVRGNKPMNNNGTERSTWW